MRRRRWIVRAAAGASNGGGPTRRFRALPFALPFTPSPSPSPSPSPFPTPSPAPAPLNTAEQQVDSGDASATFATANYPTITAVTGGYAVWWSTATQQCVRRYANDGTATTSPGCMPIIGGGALAGLPNGDVVVAGRTTWIQRANGGWYGPVELGLSPDDASISAVGLPDGTWWALWLSHQQPANGYGNDWQLRIRHVAGDGTPLGAPQDVAAVTAPAGIFNPSIGALADGSFVVAWTSQETGPVLAMMRRYAAGGTPMTDAVAIGPAGGWAVQTSGVAGLAGGGFVVMYLGEVAPRAQVFAADSTKVGPVVDVDVPPDISDQICGHTPQGPSPCVQIDSLPHVAALSDGGFVVVWNVQGRPESSIAQARRFDAGGAPVGPVTQVSSQTAFARPRVSYPNVAGSPNGTFAFAWQYDAGAPTGIYFRLYDQNGLK